jgi:hypothetical protein
MSFKGFTEEEINAYHNDASYLDKLSDTKKETIRWLLKENNYVKEVRRNIDDFQGH